MSEVKKPTLTDSVLELSKKLAAGLSIDKDTGAGTATADLYNTTLPEGLTKDIVKAVSEHNTNFVAAGAHAFGMMAVDAMAKNKKLENASVTIPMGHRDSVTHNLARSKTFINQMSENKDEVTHYGKMTSTLEVRAGKNGGQLKAARALVAEAGLAKLK